VLEAGQPIDDELGAPAALIAAAELFLSIIPWMVTEAAASACL
jgi:hypothetical protein